MYLRANPIDKLERNAAVKTMVRMGIPPELRGAIWLQLAGIKAIKIPNLYQSLLKEKAHLANPDMDAINKDLRRTFQNHANFVDEQGVAALKRVLVAYAWKNPKVGYVQSMNFVVALLLLFMDEEDAFWMLSVIVEVILPGYYTADLFGAVVDQHVLRQLIGERLPKVVASNDLLATLYFFTLWL